MVSTKCCRINIWHLICAAQWTYFLPLTNIVTTTCHAQASLDDSSQEIIEVVPLESDEFMPDACAPFINYTKADEESGQFYSPGYPNLYPPSIDCFFVLEAPRGKVIKLDFRDYFEIEESDDCQHDFLEVRDGPYGYSELINKKPICKFRTFPDEMISGDRHLWIHFKSDSTIEYRGFKAVFQFIDRASNVPEITPCIINRIDLEQGDLGIADINRSIAEYNKTNKAIDCLWTITVRKNWRIYLQFAQFNLEKPNECTSNFVQVFLDRPVEYIHNHKEFCGSLADTLLSTKNKMYVRFYTTTMGSKTKFQANFTAFRGISAEKPCDETVEFFCEDDTCIAKDLKCNKLYNCRTRFDEEDDDCHSAVPMAWNGEHIIIIMVIFSLILTGMCITFIYNCITKLIRDHQTIQEFMRSQDQLHEIDKHGGAQQAEKSAHSLSKAASQSRSHSSDGTSRRFADATAIAVNCYVPGGEVLPMPLREQRSTSPINGDAYTTNIYTVDDECPPQMCDSACQTRESLFTTQEYSSGNSSPSHHSTHLATTESPPAPFSTFGYKKDNNRFKAEAKIEVVHQHQQQQHQQDKRRPYSVQTTKSAPDVIVTH